MPEPVVLDPTVWEEMVAHAIAGVPDEACGLLGGRPGADRVEAFVACDNADHSAKTYAIGPEGWRAADEAFIPRGLEVIGVMHSHTHTDAYPSPTDIDRADNPLLAGWHYIIVSLRDEIPVLRCYRLDDRTVTEEPVVLAEP